MVASGYGCPQSLPVGLNRTCWKPKECGHYPVLRSRFPTGWVKPDLLETFFQLFEADGVGLALPVGLNRTCCKLSGDGASTAQRIRPYRLG